MQVAIAGGGIGGLAAALFLHDRGIHATVFEAVDTPRPLGVGINLLPHGSGALASIGLGPALADTGIPTRAVEYRTKWGHLIQSDPRGTDAGFPHPQYSIHRGRLQFLLRDAVRDRLGPDALRDGHRLAGFTEDAGGVTLRFEAADPVRADLLVGADGFHSAVRRQLFPDEGPAHSEGMTLWRGAAETDPVGDGRTMTIAGNHDVKLVVYPIGAGEARRGRALMNWVAEVRHGRPAAASDADWTARGTRDFARHFAEFRLPGLDPMALFAATREITTYPMIDRDPLPRWSTGRVTLLGDAAHPMFPIGANGSSQAILDGPALADALAGGGGLAAYEAARRPATAEVVLANRAYGPEAVLDLADARVSGPDDCLEDVLSAGEIEATAQRYRQVAGFTRRDD